MASTFTPNVSLEKPANGDDVNTWDVPVNADWDAIDLVFGGNVIVNVVAASGTVVLTLAQYRPRIITISGLLTANVNYQFPTGVGGTWSIFNNTTGNFTITISSGGGGTSLNLPQGFRSALSSDGTNIFQFSTAATIPTGLIGIWSGSLLSVPFGWHVCDGTSGTQDLRDKFVVGAGTTYNPGDTGGSTTQTTNVTIGMHQLLLTEIPGHVHGVTDPGHAHAVSDPGHAHAVSDPGHNHPIGNVLVPTGSGNNLGGAGGIFSTVNASTQFVGTGVGVNSNTTGIGIFTQFTGISTQNAGGNGGHSHTAAATNTTNLPPYYALFYIQKV